MNRRNHDAENLHELQRIIREAIADDLWHHRYTQLALSESTGISQPHISHILNGKRRATFKNLGELAQAAGVRVTATITTHHQREATPAAEHRIHLFGELDQRIHAEDRAARAAQRRAQKRST